MPSINEHTPVVQLNDAIFTKHGVDVFLNQLYLVHPTIGGNKWFKLKCNLQEAKRLALKTILTFGGAYSNHIYATAAACKKYGLQSIGIIRGEKSIPLNHTLTFAQDCGMLLHFVDRESYRNKSDENFIKELRKKFGDFHLIPEGGSNVLGVKGCVEIVSSIARTRDKGQNAGEIEGAMEKSQGIGEMKRTSDESRKTREIEGTWDKGQETGEKKEIKGENFDFVCCACGTGATLAGLTLALKEHQKAIGFSALKGGAFLVEEVNKFRKEYLEKYVQKNNTLLNPLPRENFIINCDYHFGGYAKVTPQLIEFAKDFEKKQLIPLDIIYTAKMMFGLYDLINKKQFRRGSKILAIHTGGLQGNLSDSSETS